MSKTGLRKAYKLYGEGRKNAPMWHDDHLDSLDEAHAKQNNSTPGKECKARKHIEQQQARNVKRIRQKLGRDSVAKLHFTKSIVSTECSTKVTMENACISENTSRFSQTNNTQPMDETLIANLGYHQNKGQVPHSPWHLCPTNRRPSIHA
jgi:hypothetical protein